MERKVDANSLLLDLAFYACFAYSFGTSQIHKMQSTYSPHVTSYVLSLNLHDENTVWTRRCVVHGRFGYHLANSINYKLDLCLQ